MQPSKYQQAIFEAFAGREDNILVQACAGSGKTTTLKMLCERIPTSLSTVALAFNKLNAEQFQAKLPPHINSATLHSLGFRMIRRAIPKVELDQKKTQRILTRLIGGPTKTRLVGKDKIISETVERVASLAMATLTDPENMVDLRDMVTAYGISLSGEEDDATDVVDITTLSNLCTSYIKLQREERERISFDDMIDHVVHYKLRTECPYDVILGDEVQDWNAQQAAFVELLASADLKAPQVSTSLAAAFAKVGRKMPEAAPASTSSRTTKSRLVLVGDRNQSMYAFRGADHRSMDNLKNRFKCIELPLSVCYRCPATVIEVAQGIVGAEIIQPRDNAPAGEVTMRGYTELDATAEWLKDGDMVMCRTNAPLFPFAMKLLKLHKKPVVRGSDGLEQGLLKMASDVVESGSAINRLSFLRKLRELTERKIDKLVKADKINQAVNLEDKYHSILAVASSCDEGDQFYQQLTATLHKIFEGEGISLSSVHRAKGMEAERCVILGYERMPHPMAFKIRDEYARNAAVTQENNMKYVSVTRSLDVLVLQELPPKDKAGKTSEFPSLDDALRK